METAEEVLLSQADQASCNGLRLQVATLVAPLLQVTPEVTPEVRLLRVLKGEMSRKALQAALSMKDEEHFRKAYLLPALEAGLVEMTIPDKPNSRLQKYRLTGKGKKQVG